MFMFTTIMVLDGRLCTLCVWPAMSVAFGTGRQTAIAHHAFICVLFCFCLVRVCIAGQILAVETEEKWAIFTLLPRAWACDDREWDTDGLCATKTCWSCGCQFNSRAIRPALQLFCVVVGIYIYINAGSKRHRGLSSVQRWTATVCICIVTFERRALVFFLLLFLKTSEILYRQITKERVRCTGLSTGEKMTE